MVRKTVKQREIDAKVIIRTVKQQFVDISIGGLSAVTGFSHSYVKSIVSKLSRGRNPMFKTYKRGNITYVEEV